MQSKLFDSELKVMGVLWREGDCTAKHISDILKQEVGWNMNTTYTVIETKVPTGYNGTFVGKFTITTGATADAAATFAGKDAWNLSKDNKGTFQVTNVKNITQLPLTGAAGTMLFSVIGLLIAGAAVTVFVKSRSTKRALNA